MYRNLVSTKLIIYFDLLLFLFSQLLFPSKVLVYWGLNNHSLSPFSPGSLLVLAGIHLHLFIFAMLMIPPPDGQTAEQLKKLSKEEEESAESELLTDTHCEDLHGSVFLSDSQYERAGANSHTHNRFLFDKVEVKSRYHPLWEASPGADSRCALVETPETPRTPKSPLRRRSSSSSMTTPRLERRPSKRMSAYLEGKIHRRQIPDDDISNIFIPSYYSWFPGYHGNGVASVPIREDNIETGQFAEEAKSLVSHKKKSMSSDNITSAKHRTASDEMKKHIAILLNFDFIVYFISTLLWSLTTTLFLTFGPDFFVRQGHSDIDAAFVFTFYGVGQFFGCIGVSVVGSFVGRQRMLMYVLANVLTGAFMAVVPFFSSFTEISAMLVGLGLVYGGILGLYMIVMVDIVGTDDMDIGLGYIMLGSGIGCFIGPPVGGK